MVLLPEWQCPCSRAVTVSSLRRGSGFQLFHRAYEEDESELPPRRSHGHPLCQHEISDPGGGSLAQGRQGLKPEGESCSRDGVSEGLRGAFSGGKQEGEQGAVKRAWECQDCKGRENLGGRRCGRRAVGVEEGRQRNGSCFWCALRSFLLLFLADSGL